MTPPHRQHPVHHGAGFAEIIAGIAQLLQRGAVEVFADFRVLGQEIKERPAGGDHLAADVVETGSWAYCRPRYGPSPIITAPDTISPLVRPRWED